MQAPHLLKQEQLQLAAASFRDEEVWILKVSVRLLCV